MRRRSSRSVSPKRGWAWPNIARKPGRSISWRSLLSTGATSTAWVRTGLASYPCQKTSVPKGSGGASASTRRRKAGLVSSGTSHTSVACGIRASVNSAAESTSAVRMPQLSRNSSASTPSTASAVTTASSGGPPAG